MGNNSIFVVFDKESKKGLEKEKKSRKLRIKLIKKKITHKEFIKESKKLGPMYYGFAKNFSAFRMQGLKRIALRKK